MPLHLSATAAALRLRARARLPRFLFDYVDGGATDEQHECEQRPPTR